MNNELRASQRFLFVILVLGTHHLTSGNLTGATGEQATGEQATGEQATGEPVKRESEQKGEIPLSPL